VTEIIKVPPPAWVTVGYADDPVGLRAAIARWYIPKTTPEERAAAAAFVAGETFPCTSCGRFAFARPRACYWCSRSGVTATVCEQVAPREQPPKREQDAPTVAAEFTLELM
jgi:hypothetical protein